MKSFPLDRKKIISIIVAAIVAIASIITLYVTILPMETDNASDEPEFAPQKSFHPKIHNGRRQKRGAIFVSI